ncbi:internal virion protein [Xanthomonas phage phi Xc10]|uniref:Internal virion protein n=2 Tax=Pradovirus Xc10 TaxID=2733952 RepID=A0A5B9N6H4_9CAUD|nr:internal virion protein [Xanthomonas phage phi Xc10]ASZ72039.1 internal virion protein [Xanthomonas phage phi Xc10]QEG09648.1 internal virion protein [Xanthomonas phage Pagan]
MGSVNTILQANNTTRVARANYRAAVAQTDNTNRSEVAKTGFADFMRSLKNNAQLDAAAKEYNSNMEALSEELRARQGAGLNSQLQLANARGALQAQAGAVGVGGSSADLMDTMVRLQAEMDKETQDNAVSLLASRGASQTAQVMSRAWNGMDMSRTFGQFDYSQHIEPKAMKRRLGKLIGVAVATYFGGPMAGEAVADFAVGTWQADNGNFQGMSQSFNNAAQNGMQAWQQSNDRGGKSWASTTFGYNDGTGKQSVTGAKVTGNFGNNYDNFSTTTSGLGWFDSGSGGNSGGAW